MKHYDIYTILIEYDPTGLILSDVKIKFQERIKEKSSIQAIIKLGKSDFRHFKEAKVVTDIRDAQYAVLNKNLKNFLYFKFIFDIENVDNFES